MYQFSMIMKVKNSKLNECLIKFINSGLFFSNISRNNKLKCMGVYYNFKNEWR